MRFVMAGGGTGGHVTPAVAVATELRARGHQPVFIGVRHGLEARIVPAAGFPIEWIDIGGLQRVGPRRLLRSLWQLPLAVLRSFRLLARLRPAAVFSLGGYVAGPVLLAAVARRIPIVAMEPNATPGLVHRRLACFLTRVLVAMPEALRFFPESRATVTGVPVRAGFTPSPLPEPMTVLITGGSQGSRTLNRAFQQSWPLFQQARSRVRFVHQAGRAEADSLAAAFAGAGLDGTVTAFIDDMPAAFAAARLIICRAGANTVAELAAAGRPAILIPFPDAADDHQTANAQSAAAAGAAITVPDPEWTGERLFAEVTRLAAEPDTLTAMAAAAAAQASPDAAAKAASELEVAAAAKQKPLSTVDKGAQSRNN